MRLFRLGNVLNRKAKASGPERRRKGRLPVTCQLRVELLEERIALAQSTTTQLTVVGPTGLPVSSAVYGQTFYVRATVSYSNASGTHRLGSGTVTGTHVFQGQSTTWDALRFSWYGAAIGWAAPIHGGGALEVGDHSFTAKYNGMPGPGRPDSGTTYSPSPPASLTVVVSKARTNTELRSSAPVSCGRQAVNFTATVRPVYPSTRQPLGEVIFTVDDNPSVRRRLVGNQATFTPSSPSPLMPGPHYVTARYDDAPRHFIGSDDYVNQEVNRAQTTTVLSPPPVIQNGQPFTLSATITVESPRCGTPRGRVYFYIDSGIYLDDKPFSRTVNSRAIQMSFAALGDHPVRATYSGDEWFKDSTGTNTLTVLSGPLAPGGGAGPEMGTGITPLLTDPLVKPILAEALARWQAAGLDAGQLSALSQAEVHVADLSGVYLGLGAPGVIWLDQRGAGYGWFIDPTPADDSEFAGTGASPARGRMDLLSVVAHELGHALGLEHSHDDADVMGEALQAGVRRMPRSGDLGAPAVGQVVGHAAPLDQRGSLRLLDGLFATALAARDRGSAGDEAQQLAVPMLNALPVALAAVSEHDSTWMQQPLHATRVVSTKRSETVPDGWRREPLNGALLDHLVSGGLPGTLGSSFLEEGHGSRE